MRSPVQVSSSVGGLSAVWPGRSLGWLAALGGVLAMQACGGGGGGEPEVDTTPKVTEVTVDQTSFGTKSTFTIKGANLTNGVSFTATGCDGLTVAAGGTASQQVVSCTPNADLSVKLVAANATSQLYTNTWALPKPKVTEVTVDRTRYGMTATFVVKGENLTNGVAYTATGCDGLTVALFGSDTEQVLSCTPNVDLSVKLVAAATATGELYSNTWTLPKPQVTLVTSMGTIVVELEPAIVKNTVDNFLTYVRSGFYNNTVFHRVVAGFVNQGGGFIRNAAGALESQAGLRTAIALESNKGLSNTRGTIAMARQNAPDTATSQFFFNTVDNLGLDYASAASPGYAVFGRIVGNGGLTVMANMNAVTTSGSVPTTDIVVRQAVQSQ